MHAVKDPGQIATYGEIWSGFALFTKAFFAKQWVTTV